MKKLLVYLVIVLIAASSSISYLYKEEKEERKRLGANQTALLENMRRYKTKDSLNVVSIQKLTLTKQEFEQHNAELAERIKDLGIKVKRLQSVTSTGTTTTTVIRTQMKDSIVYRDKDKLVRDTLQCLEYISPYLMIDACIDHGEFAGLVVSKDTLDQFVHRVPKEILFKLIKFGTKGIRQEIYSRNPYSEIHYSKYIEFKK